MKVSRPLVVLDLETTGIWIEKDRIIEIALIKLNPDGTREQLTTRVNPVMAIPAKATEITGITQEDVKDAPAFGAIAGKVLQFIGDADIGGFNVERFDLPLLAREFMDAGLQFDFSQRTIYDAQKIYHLHNKRDLTAAYAFYCHEELKDAHSALADTQATLDILEEQIKRYGKDESVESLKVFDYEPNKEYFDSDRKFRWWNGDLYMTFGKYARKEPLKVIAKKDPSYLQWVLDKDFSDDVKLMIQQILNGQHPKQEGS
ncbi:MAG: 3'-5' exonuclease [Candidatus Omnitrophica bacterium]|nr:3'-5' exonuclease [Candidatus Omnitrophota bacterium]